MVLWYTCVVYTSPFTKSLLHFLFHLWTFDEGTYVVFCCTAEMVLCILSVAIYRMLIAFYFYVTQTKIFCFCWTKQKKKRRKNPISYMRYKILSRLWHDLFFTWLYFFKIANSTKRRLFRKYFSEKCVDLFCLKKTDSIEATKVKILLSVNFPQVQLYQTYTCLLLQSAETDS